MGAFTFIHVSVDSSQTVLQYSVHSTRTVCPLSHLAEHFNWCGEFFLADLLIFLFLGGSLEALPRQAGAIEVHQHIPHALHIITTTEIEKFETKSLTLSKRI